jgi:hypothetical protein
MTDEEVMDMAEQTGVFNHAAYRDLDQHLLTFARLIAAKQRDLDAGICEASDRYRGDYFAAKIRGQK